MDVVAGIFVGGGSSRMGGRAKGLLDAPDGGPIVLRTAQLLTDAGLTPVLVGRHPAYASLALPALVDDPSAEGPLAGLLALLAHAGDRPAIAIACDMPYLSVELLRRLVDAPPAAIVAPRRAAFWEAMFARHDSAVVLPHARAFAARGERKLQRLFDELGAVPLALGPDEARQLDDWDRPEDVVRVRR